MLYSRAALAGAAWRAAQYPASVVCRVVWLQCGVTVRAARWYGMASGGVESERGSIKVIDTQIRVVRYLNIAARDVEGIVQFDVHAITTCESRASSIAD